MKNNNTLFIIILIIFGILIIGNRYQGSVQGIGSLDNSFFTTWDWTSFSWVQTHLGGAGDTIIWTLVILAIFWIITSLFQRKIEYGISGLLFFILLIGTGAYIFVSAITNANSSEEKVGKATSVNVRFTNGHVGTKILARDVNINQIIRVGIHTTHPRIHGEGKALWACPRIVRPSKLPGEVKFKIVAGNHTNVNDFAITDESQRNLKEYGILWIDVEFTQKVSTPHLDPC